MHVSLMVAITVDGKIARASDHYPDWTGSADKRLYVDVTKKAGVMIMGSTTFDIIGRVLPNRKTVVMTRNRDRRSRAPQARRGRDPGPLAPEGHAMTRLCLVAALAGLAVPGMPVGSPGMEVEGADDQPYDVIAFDESGQMEVFASYGN